MSSTLSAAVPTDPQALAEACVNAMLASDGFSAALGMELVEVAPRRASVRLTVRRDMLNGFGVCHGGVTYSLADSALAFASNTHGMVTMSIENAISYPAAVFEGDVLTAVAVETASAKRVAFYEVKVSRADQTLVALFRGTVYRTDRPLLADLSSAESSATRPQAGGGSD
jgi:acyl-CoA thioesterase